jgi:pantoate--beta-alanine ligase
MLIARKKAESAGIISGEKRKGRNIGLVPTMGAIHEGHLALIGASMNECDYTVCSIFINPAQFDNREDFIKYPVRTDEDLDMLQSAGCHAVFMPDVSELYEENFTNSLSINFGGLESVCEGKFRRGHFNGVGLVVAKLFHILQPDTAYFGQKDLQQVAVINKLVRDLSFNIRIRRIPTIRESDGLAMSSRNLRIPASDRPRASIFYNSLKKSRELLLDNVPVDVIRQKISDDFDSDPVHKLEYLELVETETFRIVDHYSARDHLAFCIAGYSGIIRLIDNILINE